MKDCPKFILLIFFGLFALAILTVSYFLMVELPDSQNFKIKVFEKADISEPAKIFLSEHLDL